ncbi:uncharacterized protein G2W53_018287 [Senna tora]|uniref:Uncharacterized protein n=1 Tax=Senna tora TaxID=362788 RepID=A0A834TRR6_9FABA|nr:uncharacterized protein G2W53_018287 [Senna tora]
MAQVTHNTTNDVAHSHDDIIMTKLASLVLLPGTMQYELTLQIHPSSIPIMWHVPIETTPYETLRISKASRSLDDKMRNHFFLFSFE